MSVSHAFACRRDVLMICISLFAFCLLASCNNGMVAISADLGYFVADESQQATSIELTNINAEQHDDTAQAFAHP